MRFFHYYPAALLLVRLLLLQLNLLLVLLVVNLGLLSKFVVFILLPLDLSLVVSGRVSVEWLVCLLHVLLEVTHLLIWRRSGYLVSFVRKCGLILIDLGRVLNYLPTELGLNNLLLLWNVLPLILLRSLTTFRCSRYLRSRLQFAW